MRKWAWVGHCHVKYSRINALPHGRLLFVEGAHRLEGLHVVNVLQLSLPEVLYRVVAQREYRVGVHKLKEINHRRVEQVVAALVREEGVHDRSKEVDSDDVPIVELILQSD